MQHYTLRQASQRTSTASLAYSDPEMALGMKLPPSPMAARLD